MPFYNVAKQDLMLAQINKELPKQKNVNVHFNFAFKLTIYPSNGYYTIQNFNLKCTTINFQKMHF